MTKVYHARIEVEAIDGRPRRFKWRDEWKEVRTVYERSMVRSEWWRDEVSRTHYSLECDGLELYDIYRDGDRWFLERVWD
jgi:hypothetical protein